MWISSGPYTTVKRTVGTGGTVRGSLCAMSSDTAVKAAANPTDGTIFGIATDTYAATDVGIFYKITSDTQIAAKYTGSSKTSLTDADLGKSYDLSSDLIVNLDDTSGGPFICDGYDNDNDIIYGHIVAVERVY